MSDTVETLKKKASKIYKDADASAKKALADLFGKDAFKKSIIEEVQTIEDVCRIEGIKLSDILPYKKPSNDEEENTNNFAIVKLICKVLNQGWKPDFKNKNQPKYYPYFEMINSGFRFCGADCGYGCDCAGTGLGSRLCYETAELAEHAGRAFLSYYEKLIIK